MKQTLFAFLLGSLLISFGSCQKDDPIQNNDTPVPITGTWELRQTSAAMSPSPTHYASGNGNKILFTNSHYETYANGVLVKKGNYEIIQDTTAATNVCLVLSKDQYAKRIVFDSAYNTSKIFIQIVGNTLNFISGCYAVDAGHSEAYEKIEN